MSIVSRLVERARSYGARVTANSQGFAIAAAKDERDSLRRDAEQFDARYGQSDETAVAALELVHASEERLEALERNAELDKQRRR